MTALGYELQQRGHRVTVIGVEDAKSKVLAAGLGFERIGLADYPLGATKKVFTRIGNSSGLEALRMTIQAIAKAGGVKRAADIVEQAIVF